MGSLNSFLSYASQLSGAKSCFLVHLAAYIPPAPQQAPSGVPASAGSQFWGALVYLWRPEITDSHAISCLLI